MKRFWLTIVLVLLVVWRAPAATITANGFQTNVNSVPAAQIGSDGYVFYGINGTGGPGTNVFTGMSAATPVSYLSIAGGNGTYGDSTYTSLTIGGTAYKTGVLYQSPVALGSTGTIATLTLQSGVPGSFVLSILEDNATAAANNMSLLTVNGMNSASQIVAGNSVGVNNDFYSFLISNAAPGDTITINVTNNGVSDGESHLVIGGLAFAPVPEPSTWIAGAGTGLCLVVARARRRFEKR